MNSVTTLLQSREGYVWAATWDGLVRLDGARVVVFNTGNTEALPSSRFVQGVEAPDGSLFFRTAQQHVVRWRAGVFTHFDARRGLPTARTRALYRDGTGQLWAATSEGVWRLDGERFIRVLPELRVHASALLRDGDGVLWIGTADDGVYRVRGAEVTHYSPTAGLGAGQIGHLARTPDGALWVGTESGAWRLVGSRAEPALFEDGRPVRAEVLGMWTAPARARGSGGGEVWVAARGGLYVSRAGRLRAVVETPRLQAAVWFDPQGVPWYGAGDVLYRDGRAVFQLSPASPERQLNPGELRDVLWDREGGVWLATDRRGLYRLRPAAFTVFSEPEGLTGRRVLSVFEDRAGALWIGARDLGLTRLRGGVATAYMPPRGPLAAALAFMQDRAGDLWVGTEGQGVLRCRLPAVSCAPVAGSERGTVRALYEDSAGTVWAGTGLGLQVLRGGVWRNVPEAGSVAYVRFFLRGRDGTLWMATDGAGVLAHRHGRYSRLTTQDGLPSNSVRALYEDPAGRLWVGTEGRGLARVVPDVHPDGRVTARAVRAIRQHDGLYDEVIHVILPDDQGRLWMSSNRGIFAVRADELDAVADGRRARVQSVSYSERDGLRNREGNGGEQPAGVRTRDGRLWFATQDGAASVDPARVGRDPAPPPVVVEQVRGRHGVRGATAGAPADLTADERSFEIDYTAPSFGVPENVRFRYRLDGVDEDWVDAGRRRTAFYTNVPPGTYTFRVSASTSDGVWGSREALLTLRVAPRAVETPLARGLAALGTLLVGAGAYRWRVRRLRGRARELSALVETRTVQLRAQEASLAEQNAQLAVQARRLAELDEAKSRLFANLSHEFRTPLTLILGPLAGLLAGRHGPLGAGARQQGELMLRNGQRLLRLINQVLDLAKVQAGRLAVAPTPGELVAFARAATHAFAPLAEGRRVTLRFRSDVDALPVAFDPAPLETVLFNLLSNALKFTAPGGRVEVVVTADAERDGAPGATITVRDSGVGIVASELPHVFDRFYQADAASTRRYGGTGIGLALTRELVELHGGVITADSTPGVGSVFSVWLPRADVPDGDVASPVGASGARASGAASAEGLAAAWDVRPAADAHAAPDEEAIGDHTTVLVIDDDPDVRAYVRSVLAPTYHVLEEADGAAGLERARARLPDLIVADVMMPGLDGLALTRALKEEPMTDAIPVVLLTARTTPEDQVAGFGTGADAYLAKPFDPAVLEACVSALLAQRRRLRARFAGGGAAVDGEVLPAEAPGVPGTAWTVPPLAVPQGRAYSPVVQRLADIVAGRLADRTLDPKALAAAAGLSYHQLYRAIRDECQTSPSQFIRGVRAERAAELLQRGAGNVTEVAYAVGFESLSYFSRAFRERFGVAPSAYLKPSEGGPAGATARTSRTPSRGVSRVNR